MHLDQSARGMCLLSFGAQFFPAVQKRVWGEKWFCPSLGLDHRQCPLYCGRRKDSFAVTCWQTVMILIQRWEFLILD